MSRALKRTLRRWLYIGHRWIGIITCLFFAMWFISGVVMMYVAFPGLSDKERLAALPDIRWEKVTLSPDDAMKKAGATRYPRGLRLSMLADEPVYRMTAWDGTRLVISAADGRAITNLSEGQALAIAQYHPASRTPQLEEIVDRDQWSVTARYDPLRPLYLIALGDDAGTKLYVSSRSGEIALDIPTIAAKLPTLQFGATEARFVWLDGSPMIIVASRDGTQTPLDVASGEFAKLSQDRLWTAAAKLLPHAHITERLTLKEYDAYWYAHHHDRALPVLRAVFDDDAKTWFHISPVTGDIIGRVDSSRRTYRWLFNALHSFDFQLFLMYRPAWDIVVWLLSILGTIVSVGGVVIGWRYLRG